MSENEPAPETPPEAPQPARRRWHQRTWSLPALVVVALVAVLLGGLGGAALATAGNHQDGRGGVGPGHGSFRGPGGRLPGQQQGRNPFRQQPGQQPGQQQQGQQQAP